MVTLFSTALVLLPFNDLPYFSWLFGELGTEGAFLPLLLAVLWFFPSVNFRFSLPRLGSVAFLLLFLGAVLLSGAVNSFAIMEAQFAGRSGISKFVLQLSVLLFGVCLAILVFNLAHRKLIDLRLVRRFLTISFLIAGGYSFFEVLFNLGTPWAEAVIEAVNPWFHTELQGVFFLGQVRSVTGEPSWFGMYAALLFPWLASYLFTEETIWPYGVLTLYLIFLVFLSSSRLAYGLVLVESLLMLSFMIRAGILSVGLAAAGLFFLALTALAGFYFADLMAGAESLLLREGLVASLTSQENLSNICRYGTQVAAISMGLDHPFWGVGMGQFPFHMEKYLPAWAMISPEIRDYLHGVTQPLVHGLYARIAGEVGLVGLGLWLAFIGTLTLRTWKTAKSTFSGSVDWLGLSLAVNLVAIAGFGFSTAGFKAPGIWIMVGLAWAYPLADHPRFPPGEPA
jgi:hypothetical protein